MEKIVEDRFRLFGHMWRKPIESPLKKVDWMEVSPIIKDRRRLRSIIYETMKKTFRFKWFVYKYSL